MKHTEGKWKIHAQYYPKKKMWVLLDNEKCTVGGITEVKHAKNIIHCVNNFSEYERKAKLVDELVKVCELLLKWADTKGEETPEVTAIIEEAIKTAEQALKKAKQ